MSRIVQEKFQVDYAQNRNDDADSGWKSDKSARAKKGTPGREGRPGGDPGSRVMNNAVFYTSLPPGADLEDQEMTDQRQMALSSGNLGNGEQVTTDVTGRSLRTGYDRKRLLGTDDQYTNEHNDSFYWDATVDGVTGFLERNNMLDRE